MANIQRNRMKQAQIYDKTAKDLRELQPEDMVMIEPFGYGKQWQKATVTKQIGPRSYEVETTKGTKLIRNRKHLRQMKQNTVKNQQKLSQVTGKGMTGVDLPMTRTPSQERKQQQQASSKQTQRSSGRITKMPAYLADYKLC
ncbi:uncharacterized protein LOC134191617 [Corticium candelabrum]|uniref:uncharacterized protein LOC134191617 n=1 Tax=Corticium candelabrum TaxID=121492 RepID=UPI002E27048B|nr:uncharacterized protein LOC134191617 [Corticium candelabrum]